MAGVKGKSGGPRKNAGGARPGAGRPPKDKEPAAPAPAQADTPLAFLKGVMNDIEQDPKLRVRAAIAAAQYEHTKMSDGGKKDAKQDAAKKVAGRFAQAAPPKLVAAGGKKV